MVKDPQGGDAYFNHKEVEYAVQILDGLYNNGPMSAKELSESKDIPSPFIYRVLKSWRPQTY